MVKAQNPRMLQIISNKRFKEQFQRMWHKLLNLQMPGVHVAGGREQLFLHMIREESFQSTSVVCLAVDTYNTIHNPEKRF